MHLTFKHNQILVIGEYGQGKTTLCVHHALHRAFWWGHPVFSNAAALFGRRISPEELYTCIVDMPRDGVLFIDEASAAAESGMGGRVAIAALSSSLLNNRKQNVQVLYATAQDHQIAFPFGTGLGHPPSVSVSGRSFAGGLWEAFSAYPSQRSDGGVLARGRIGAFSAFTPFAPLRPFGRPEFRPGRRGTGGRSDARTWPIRELGGVTGDPLHWPLPQGQNCRCDRRGATESGNA